jgi:hypothetical protein
MHVVITAIFIDQYTIRLAYKLLIKLFLCILAGHRSCAAIATILRLIDPNHIYYILLNSYIIIIDLIN